jgi:peptide/nickel transport system ATP-binding protein
MSDATPLLDIRGLSIRIAQRRVVDSVHLSVPPGALVAIVGESGSGKSLTALSILRLLPPAAAIEQGQILLHDPRSVSTRDLLHLHARDLRRVRGGEIAMIFQEPMTSFNPVFSIAEQLTEAIRLHAPVSAKEARARAIQALADVAIPNPAQRIDEYPHQWSGGMRQRAMIAMALACNPSLLIADEPTSALDASVQVQILDLLQRQRSARGLAILLITHDLALVARRADHVYVMLAGRIVESAPARDLFAAPLHPYTKALLASRPSIRRRAARLGVQPVAHDEPPLALPTGLEHAWWPAASHPPAPRPAVDSRLVEAAPSHFVRVRAAASA